MRTENGWPAKANTVDENACLVFTAGTKENTTTTYYPSLKKAIVAFTALYNEYPGIVWEGTKREPNYTHRCSSPHHNRPDRTWWNSEYGREVSLFYKDERREGWHSPCCDGDGRFYRGAFLCETELHTVPGYGYMQRGQHKRDDLLPAGTARGDRDYENPDLVNIGGVTIDQRELNRIYDLTGELSTHLTFWDQSGSCLYLKEIVWGDEPQIVADELAA